MNDYQKNIYNLELLYPGTAIANIGGVLKFDVDISFEMVLEIIGELVKKTPSLNLRLNKEGVFYEGKNIDKVDRVILSCDEKKAFEFAENLMKKPFSKIFNSSLYSFSFIEYDRGCMLLMILHHLIGDAAAIALLCDKFQSAYFLVKEGKEIVINDVDVKYKNMTDKRKANAVEYFKKKIFEYEHSKITDKESLSCSVCLFSVY